MYGEKNLHIWQTKKGPNETGEHEKIGYEAVAAWALLNSVMNSIRTAYYKYKLLSHLCMVNIPANSLPEVCPQYLFKYVTISFLITRTVVGMVPSNVL